MLRTSTQRLPTEQLAGFMVYDPTFGSSGYRNGRGTFDRPDVGQALWSGPVDPRESNPDDFRVGRDLWFDVPLLVDGEPHVLDLIPEADVRTAHSWARRLRGDWLDASLRVYETAGETQNDIGMTMAGLLNEDALLAHVGEATGYCRLSYDQSGSGRNLSRILVGGQPRIVSGGNTQRINDRPALEFGPFDPEIVRLSFFDGGEDVVSDAPEAWVFIACDPAFINGIHNLFTVSGSTLATQLFVVRISSGNWEFRGRRLFSDSLRTLVGPAATTGPMVIAAGANFISGDAEIWINGVKVADDDDWHSGGNTDSQLPAGGRIGNSILAGTDDPFTGYVAECIVVGSEMTDGDKIAVQQNQMEFYGIE
jgi:hypothetical protein